MIWGALRIRLLPGRYGAADPGWGDALAVVSVVLPVLFLVYFAVGQLVILGGFQPAPKIMVIYTAAQLLARAVLAALVLLGLRRTAALAAGAALIWFAVSVADAPNWSYLEPEVVVIFAFLALEIVALLASPGPRRGLQIMTWKRHALLVAPAAAAGLAAWETLQISEAIVVTVAMTAVAAMTLASPLSRRIIAVLLVPLYYWAVSFVVLPSVINRPDISVSGWEGPLRLTVTALPVNALLCPAIAALLRSAHHLRRPPAL